MQTLKDRYSITELSQSLSVTDHTLRYYEKEFNLFIPKDQRGRRYYTPDLANLFYQIKKMRDEGLELKAIRKILISQEIINEKKTQPSESIIPVQPNKTALSNENIKEIKTFFEEFSHEIITGVSKEVFCIKEEINKEISKSKLELGACFENNTRKLESKLEKHFKEVDESLKYWREKNKKHRFRSFFDKIIR